MRRLSLTNVVSANINKTHNFTFLVLPLFLNSSYGQTGFKTFIFAVSTTQPHCFSNTPSCANRLKFNNPYMARTAPLTSKRCILYIYSTNTGTKYFKHALYSPFFSLQNAVCFIMLTCLGPVLFTFYIQSVLKLKKNNSGAKGLKWKECSSQTSLYAGSNIQRTQTNKIRSALNTFRVF